eukprot:scaffold60683_cov21-Tisochrysis_lutea.AAC.4
MVRAAGGVCIADEVQTGFGRTGTNYWGFQNQCCASSAGTSRSSMVGCTRGIDSKCPGRLLKRH